MIDDWLVTLSIYENGDELLLTSDTSGVGSVRLNVNTRNTAFFLDFPSAYIVEPLLPTMLLDFTYSDDSLFSVDISWPGVDSLPLTQWIQWIKSKTTALVAESQLSSTICDFIVNESLQYFRILRKSYSDDDSDYIAFALDESIFAVFEKLSAQMLCNGRFDSVALLVFRKNSKNRFASLAEFTTSVALMFGSFYCPICLDPRSPYIPSIGAAAVPLECGHILCYDCYLGYTNLIWAEMSNKREYPFLCPHDDCKKVITVDFLSLYASKENISLLKSRIEAAFSVPPTPSNIICCPLRTCGSYDMVRKVIDGGRWSDIVYCDTCGSTWCERCLHRYTGTHDVCDDSKALGMCSRYEHFDAVQKARADAVYPWMKAYVEFMGIDHRARDWCRARRICGSGP